MGEPAVKGGSHSGGGDVVQAVGGPSLGRTGRVPEVQAGPYGWSRGWGWVPEAGAGGCEVGGEAGLARDSGPAGDPGPAEPQYAAS